MNSHELWQVEVDGRVYEACMDEVIEWIHEGAVLPSDRIRRGNLRWLAAKRVPELDDHFNRSLSPPSLGSSEEQLTDNDPPGPNSQADNDRKARSTVKGFCSKHRSQRAAYVCATCGESYCSDCCNRFGNVKLCPQCGTMCLPYTKVEELDQIHGALNRPYARKISASADTSETDSRLTFPEILAALRQPFARPFSLVGYVVALAVSSVIAAAALMAEVTYAAISIASMLIMAALMLRTAESAFEEATLNVRHHGQLSRGLSAIRNCVISIVSGFGPFIVLITAAMVFAWFQFSGSVDLAQSQMTSAQNEVTKFVSENDRSAQNRERFNTAIEARRENLVNSFFGSTNGNTSVFTMAQSLLRLSVFFLLPIGAAFLIGVVLFPAVCINTLDAENMFDRVNPVRVFKKIRAAGYEYVKLLSIGIVFSVLLILVSVLIEQATELSGSIAAAFIVCVSVTGALFAYVWIVFSRLLILAFLETPTDDSPNFDDFHVITQIQ
jgi:hypothetical protein